MRWPAPSSAPSGRRAGLGGVEAMLREYSLSTKEGLALMVLAEALLRVPDAATADRLIEDKLRFGGFEQHATRSEALLVRSSAWALGLSARIIQPGDTPEGILAGLAKRLGLPAVRQAARQAMRVMGGHFVLGETIEAALKRSARTGPALPLLLRHARRGRPHGGGRKGLCGILRRRHRAIGRAAGNKPLPDRPASRSSSRRSIRATRRSAATG